MIAGLIGGLVGAGGLGALIWYTTGTPSSAAKPREPDPAWDLGPSLAPRLLVGLRIGAGVIVALLVLGATHNIGVAGIFGAMGGLMPVVILRRMAATRRAKLDTQAYTLANSLRLLLPISDNVVSALTDAMHNAEEPLKSILAQSLRAETRHTGAGTEMIRQIGRDVRQADLELLGDILVQIRTQTTRASRLLEDLVAMWGSRLQTEQKRLGKISGSTRLGFGMIVISVGIQVFWPAFSAGARHSDGTVVGLVMGSVGAAMTAGAFWLLDRAVRKAMNAVR
ncbi:hypothetical protein [Sulfobacillus sp. hq2]|uniref:hypothetical protein n=1 Tax=Sulfobacillus TaxID=28033 RepID=UPI000CD1BA11|nr:hypothetical protein [Sulfobacillus sp. hq2]POB12312.1 hypothetical protein CO251_00145 [Sulfobacillus sp. hq2]